MTAPLRGWRESGVVELYHTVLQPNARTEVRQKTELQIQKVKQAVSVCMNVCALIIISCCYAVYGRAKLKKMES